MELASNERILLMVLLYPGFHMSVIVETRKQKNRMIDVVSKCDENGDIIQVLGINKNQLLEKIQNMNEDEIEREYRRLKDLLSQVESETKR